jgi:manganese/zinc/iron transport system permease protein
VATQSLTDVSIAFPSLEQIRAVMLFQAGYNSAVVLAGVTFLGIGAGLVGTFSLLRKRALVGDALAHSALPGLTAAYILATYLGIEGRSLPILFSGAAISGIIGSVCVVLVSRYTRLSEDVAVGSVLSVFFGLGIVLLSVIQSLGTGSEGGVHHFIYGQTAALRATDSYMTLGVAIAAIILSALLLKEFRLLCFDEEFARVQGWPATLIDLILMALIVSVIIVGLQSVGMLLVVALLIVPAAAARFWTERLNKMLILSGLFGGLSGYLGASVSALLPRMPAGAVIVLCSGAIFLFSFLFAPCRGVLSELIRSAGLQLRIIEDHLLRSIYESTDQAKVYKGRPELNAKKLSAICGGSSFLAWVLYLRLRARDLITNESGSRILTERGLKLAKQKTRNHQLWERYIANSAHLSPSHVDYSADLAEHVLSPELVAALEQELSLSAGSPIIEKRPPVS